MTPSIFIKKVHQYSGLALIFLIFSKILSGFILTGQIELSTDAAYLFHFAKWIDIPLIILFTIHSVYGIIKIFTKPRDRNKPRVFWIINSAAIAIILLALYVIYFY